MVQASVLISHLIMVVNIRYVYIVCGNFTVPYICVHVQTGTMSYREEHCTIPLWT